MNIKNNKISMFLFKIFFSKKYKIYVARMTGKKLEKCCIKNANAEFDLNCGMM